MGCSDQRFQNFKNRFLASMLAVSLGSLTPLALWSTPVRAEWNRYCRLDPAAIAQKDALREAALSGNSTAKQNYEQRIQQDSVELRNCRSKNWPSIQAVWLRVYPCDTRAGVIDKVLDDIVNKGYNQVYLEVFYDSQVLLPQNENNTPWPSVLRNTAQSNTDLLAEVIQKGRARGMKVYAWMFSLNFGYAYATKGDRATVMARNGRGQTSLQFVKDGAQGFVDPYHPTAQRDYYNMVQKVLQRRPDGILFDYIRYPKGSGSDSVVASVNDLWIFGPASSQALVNRAQNRQGKVLVDKYLSQRKVSQSDVAWVLQNYPDEGVPRWQGRNASASEANLPLPQLTQRLNRDLWYLAVSHAAQGVLDFLKFISLPAQRQGIQSGAVFFPEANQIVGQSGYDSRLQPWDRFPTSLEWHPMSYGVCGTPNCIVDQIRRVVSFAPPNTKIVPAIAGNWDKPVTNRPALIYQMEAIRRAFPQINSVSHFAYSWLEPEYDNNRKFCRL